MRIRRGRRVAAVGVGVSAAMLLAACGSDAIEGGDDDAGSAGAAADAEIDCGLYEEFGDLQGTTVTWYTPVRAPDDEDYINALVPFEECTGVDVQYEGSAEFEAQLVVRVQAGNAPDIAMFPQPGLLASLVRDTGAVVPAPDSVEEVVDESYSPDWKQYGEVDGEFYGAPNSSNAKSFVWYSPSAFEEAGYEVPETWDEMIALSDQIVADNPDGNVKPWCAGIGSGDATGWPATDWMEDVMLRLHGPDVYDQWVNHEIPFNDPKVLEVIETVGSILKNPDYVNGGIGDVQSIASTSFQDGGLPIASGQCYMHRQASFYGVNFPEGTEIGEDADVWAFYLPPINDQFGSPLLGGGEINAAFDDRPEVQALQRYLVSEDFINIRAAGPNFIAPSSQLDTSVLPDPITVLSAELLTDPETTFRFDASDLMPGAVGSGSFWSEMTAWIAEDKDSQAVLDAIEASWPAS